MTTVHSAQSSMPAASQTKGGPNKPPGQPVSDDNTFEKIASKLGEAISGVISGFKGIGNDSSSMTVDGDSKNLVDIPTDAQKEASPTGQRVDSADELSHGLLKPAIPGDSTTPGPELPLKATTEVLSPDEAKALAERVATGYLAERQRAPIENSALKPTQVEHGIKSFPVREIGIGSMRPENLRSTLENSRIANIDFMKGKDPQSDLTRLLTGANGKTPPSNLELKKALANGNEAALSRALNTGPLGTHANSRDSQSVNGASSFSLDAIGSSRAQSSEWTPITVKPGSNTFGRDLIAALGDRLNMQINQNVKEATVRLDPPEMGRVDLTVRMDGDKLSVTIGSNNAQVREILAQQMERLRFDLGQNNAQVDVQIGQGKSDKEETRASGSSVEDDSGDDAVLTDIEGPAQRATERSNSKPHWLNTKA